MTRFPAVVQLAPSGDATETTAPVVVPGLVAAPGAPADVSGWLAGPELHGNAGNVDRWVRVKTETLVLGVKKSLWARPNERSAQALIAEQAPWLRIRYAF